MWNAIKGFFALIPFLQDAFEWIKAFVARLQHELRKREAMEKYEKADEKAQKTGDTSELEDAFRDTGGKS